MRSHRDGEPRCLSTLLLSCDLPVARDGLEVTVVSTERDVESDDGLASGNEPEVLRVDAGHVSGVVVEELDLLEETRLVVLVELGSEVLGGESTGRGLSG